MFRIYIFLILTLFTSCRPVKFFVVRHAEKETTSAAAVMNTPNDPPLSAAGKARSIELMEKLRNGKIAFIFSTNTIRTIATARPFHEFSGIPVEMYNSRDSLEYFIRKLKSISKGNALIVGHSNTVDDIVNKLCGANKIPQDLPDSEYDNLFIVTRKGKKIKFENKTYGTPTN